MMLVIPAVVSRDLTNTISNGGSLPKTAGMTSEKSDTTMSVATKPCKSKS